MFREVQAEIAAATASQLLTSASAAGAATTASMPCPSDCSAVTAAALQAGDLEYPRQKANRLAVRKSHRVRNEILRQLAVHPGRRTAPRHFESGTGFGGNFTDEVAARSTVSCITSRPAKAQSPIYRSSWSRPSRNLTDCWKCPWTSMRILRFWMTG